jgi:nucleoid-associated protein YgaU
MRAIMNTAIAGLLITLVAAGGCKKDRAARDVANEPDSMGQTAYYESPQSSTYIESTPYSEPALYVQQTLGESEPIAVAPEPPMPATPDSYTIRRGDTLWSVARQVYGDGNRWRDIADANGISNPKKLRIGQKLMIP